MKNRETECKFWFLKELNFNELSNLTVAAILQDGLRNLLEPRRKTSGSGHIFIIKDEKDLTDH